MQKSSSYHFCSLNRYLLIVVPLIWLLFIMEN